MQYWNPEWRLERAGFGGDGVGAMPGLRGSTHLDGDVLATYPRDEACGVVLRHTFTSKAKARLCFEVAADEGRAWELLVYAGNQLLHREIVEGKPGGRQFDRKEFELPTGANREVSLRLYQRTLMPNAGKIAGNAYWRHLVVE